MVKIKEEYRKLDVPGLQSTLDALRRQLFVLRLNKETSHQKDNSQFKKLRKNIARVLTYLRQHKHNVGKL